jgi:hypothetical protein
MNRLAGPMTDGMDCQATGTVTLMEMQTASDHIFKLVFNNLVLVPPKRFEMSEMSLYLTQTPAHRAAGNIIEHTGRPVICSGLEGKMPLMHEKALKHANEDGDFGGIVVRGLEGGLGGGTTIELNADSFPGGATSPLFYTGVFIVKMATSSPVTSEAVILGVANLSSYGLPVKASKKALGMHDDMDNLEQLANRVAQEKMLQQALKAKAEAEASRSLFGMLGNKLGITEAAKRKKEKERQQRDLEKKKSRRSKEREGGGDGDGGDGGDGDDGDGGGELGAGGFDVNHSTRQTKRVWKNFGKAEKGELSYPEFREALDHLDIVVLEPRARELFEMVDLDKSGAIEMTELELAIMIAAKLPPQLEVSVADSFHTFDLARCGHIDQMEMEEALRILGIPDTTKKEQLRIAKLFHEYAVHDSVDIDCFKEIWAQLVDVAAQLRKRRQPVALGGEGARHKNISRLLFCLSEEDEDKEELLEHLRTGALQAKAELRNRKLLKSQAELSAVRDQAHAANKETALRAKAERMRKRREMKQKALDGKRERELNKKLEVAKAERLRQERSEFNHAREEQAALELAETRQKQEDKLDISGQNLRRMPTWVMEKDRMGKTSGDRLGKLTVMNFRCSQ